MDEKITIAKECLNKMMVSAYKIGVDAVKNGWVEENPNFEEDIRQKFCKHKEQEYVERAGPYDWYKCTSCGKRSASFDG